MPVHAQEMTQAMAGGVVSGANTAIRNAMSQPQQPKTVTKRQDGLQSSVAQVPPVSQQPVGGAQQAGLPVGFNYFGDFSMADPFGDIGNRSGKWLQGGMDGMLSYGFSPTSRVVASYYDLQHYPYGFNSGTVPFYLPAGLPANSCVNLDGSTKGGCSPENLDMTTKDKFLLLSYEQLISAGKVKGRDIPLVITPTYVARWSQIDESGIASSDVVSFVNPNNGLIVNGNSTRSAQYWSVAITAPFLKTPRMFGTFTVAPTWLDHPNGVNITNHAQLYQILYLEYSVTKSLRLFAEPQVSRDYLPTDPYPQHLAAYFVGLTQRVAKNEFVQLVYNTGGPTNYSPYGIEYFQCSMLPCSTPGHSAPAIGGLKASQLQVQFGIGSPVVLPL
ncbi:MAG TPA: hypothetical protein VMF61_06330 [Candidatus Acidoferrales bacterium]|nr:hypothetical protein [Candidatus Acidoferrales bacterium]